MTETSQDPQAAPDVEEPRAGVGIECLVNGRKEAWTVSPGLSLVEFLRNNLRLTGTKFGCDTGQCGACTVLLDGISVKSCSVLAAQANGREITTVEGLANGSQLSALQASFTRHHAVQCGYCTPGMLLSMTDLLRRDPHPSEGEIRRALDGNICRCGVYQNAVDAVLAVSSQAGQ